MKTLKYALIVLLLISLFSCKKEDQEMPGNIPGMGNTPGELELKETYTFPQGIVLVGQVTGLPEDLSGYSRFGSGYYVKIKMTFLNLNSEPRTIFLPKGLLVKSDSPDYQNGLLIQTTWISIESNMERNVILDLYCLNRDLPGPDENATYTILGTTGSRVINGLLDIIGWRKVNYEMIYGAIPGTTPPKSVYTYKEITDRFQEILHNLTFYGRNISNEEKEFIESINILSPAETPFKDANGNYPAYFKEFETSGL